MAGEYYPTGFSPEEVAERASRNPKELVETLIKFLDRFKEYEQEMVERINRLQELCKDWQPEYYQEYLKTIYELCDIYFDIQNLSEFGKTLRDWHSF